jgi:hypothetical protein
VLMIKLVAAFFLVLGSGLIFKALVEMDAPAFRPKPLPRRPLPAGAREQDTEIPLRRAA